VNERITPRQLQQLAENIDPDTGTNPVDLVWIELLVAEVRRLRALIGDGTDERYSSSEHGELTLAAADLVAEAQTIREEQP